MQGIFCGGLKAADDGAVSPKSDIDISAKHRYN
jgi:hypothetical protein